MNEEYESSDLQFHFWPKTENSELVVEFGRVLFYNLNSQHSESQTNLNLKPRAPKSRLIRLILGPFHLLLQQDTATLRVRSKDSYSPAIEGIFKKMKTLAILMIIRDDW